MFILVGASNAVNLTDGLDGLATVPVMLVAACFAFISYVSGNTISCLVIIPTAPSEPPNDKDPVSPIKIFAGGALNHKKPKQAPIIDPQKIEASPTPSIYAI